MHFSNSIVLGCSVLKFVIGSVWYGPLFGKRWGEAAFGSEEEIQKRIKAGSVNMTLMMLFAFVSSFFQTFVSLTLLEYVNPTSLVELLSASLFIVFGILLAPVALGDRFEMRNSHLSLINYGYFLVSFLLPALLWFHCK